MMATDGLHREHVEDVCMSVCGRVHLCVGGGELTADKQAVRGKGYVGHP